MKTLTKLIAKSAITGGTLIGLGLLSAPAQAASITYTFDTSFDGESSVSQTVGGVTGTFSGINSSNGKFSADGDGIYLDFLGGYGNQFNISFDQAVQFLTYSVPYSDIGSGQTATFALSNPNGASSTGNNLAIVGTFPFSNQFILNAGQTSTLTATLSSSGQNSAQIKSITVDYTPVSAVPEPLTILGALTAAGFGAGFKRRRDQADKG